MSEYIIAEDENHKAELCLGSNKPSRGMSNKVAKGEARINQNHAFDFECEICERGANPRQSPSLKTILNRFFGKMPQYISQAMPDEKVIIKQCLTYKLDKPLFEKYTNLCAPVPIIHVFITKKSDRIFTRPDFSLYIIFRM
ncbi:hypothetical protein J6O48_11570 [bacterium]|nr:hypothetical protein [bacterium]